MPLPSIHRSVVDEVAIIRPIGEFDIDCVDLLRSELLASISPERIHLVVDMEATTFMDSMALGTVIGAQRRVRGWGGWLRVARPQPQIRKLLQITGLDTVIEVHDSLEAAGVKASNAPSGLVEL